MNPQSQYRSLPGRGVRRLALAGVALVAGAMSSACDPCFGVTACEAPGVWCTNRVRSPNTSGSCSGVSRFRSMVCRVCPTMNTSPERGHSLAR